MAPGKGRRDRRGHHTPKQVGGFVCPVHWFLNDRDDTRSSYYLEDVATEFQVQGLELDWACVTWDGDFRYKGSGWNYHEFRGAKWTNVRKEENQS